MVEREQSLKDSVIAVPESRQLLLLTEMMLKRGARVMPVPLVSIHDAADPGPVLSWLDAFIAEPPDILILLTGEGLRRLLSLAKKHDRETDFISVLGEVKKLCRGPKPNRALREIGLEQELAALSPTTEGVIATLDGLELRGLRIAVQLYGEDPNQRLMSYLSERGAIVSQVAPYRYADKTEEDKVVSLLNAMQSGEVDVIAFTSMPQVKRLLQVANNRQMQDVLQEGMQRTAVAAVGPVVRDLLQSQGFRVDIMPQRTYFMKPMVRAIADFLHGEAIHPHK